MGYRKLIKVLGKFKEMNGKILEELIGLASKFNSNKVFASNNDEMKKAKGVKKNIIVFRASSGQNTM